MCSYKEAISYLAEKYIKAEYYAVGKDLSKLDKTKLKQQVIDFISAEFESIYKNFKKKIKEGGLK